MQMKMSRLTTTTNVIMKSDLLVKKNTARPSSYKDDNIGASPMLIKSLILNTFLIIHTLMSEIQMFNFVKDSKESFHLNEI